ncbi:MAG: hypothetical protein ACREI3_06615 [Nitrospirales bacterium]
MVSLLFPPPLNNTGVGLVASPVLGAVPRSLMLIILSRRIPLAIVVPGPAARCPPPLP